MIEFDVEGLPVAQGSMRRNRYGAIFDAHKGLKHWRELIGWSARNHHKGPPLEGAIALFLSFRLLAPKRMPKARVLPTVPPDLDKLQRAIFDALEKSNVVNNDAQITRVVATKTYARPPLAPGVHVIVERDIQ